MQRIFTVLTLICIILTVFAWNTAYAGWNGYVDTKEKNITTDKDKAETQYDVMQYANGLYDTAKEKYEANEAEIERGVRVTAAKMLAETVNVVVSQGITVPVTVGAIVDLLNLSDTINNSTSLLSAYEARSPVNTTRSKSLKSSPWRTITRMTFILRCSLHIQDGPNPISLPTSQTSIIFARG